MKDHLKHDDDLHAHETDNCDYPNLIKDVALGMDIVDSSLSINLNNFENPIFEGSKYVLTSPRSLEACARYSIKPVELLYRPLTEFQEELLPQNVPVRTIYDIYEQSEKERINKLVMCREARLKIMMEERSQEGESIAIYIQDDPREKTRKALAMDVYKEVQAERDTAYTTDEAFLVKDMQLEAAKPCRKSNKVSVSRTTRRPGRSVSFNLRRASAPKHTSLRKKQYSKGGDREDPDGEEVRSEVYSDGEVKRRSTSNLSMSSSRTGMSRQSLWSDARPITDASIRSKLRTSSNTKVKAKDQRILELMIKKREEAKQQQQLRETAQLAWEEEKAKAVASQADSGSRRSSLSQPRSKSQPRLKDRSKSTDSYTTLQNLEQYSKVDIDISCDKRTSQSLRALQERERKMLEKRQANMERKKLQEQRLAEQEREKAAQKSQIKAKLELDMKRAQSLKEARERDEAKQRKLKAYYAKKKQEEKLHQIRKQSEEEQEQLAVALEHKLEVAEGNLQARHERRLADAKQSMTDLQKRLELSRQNQLRIQEEMDAWHNELQNYRKLMDEKAKEQTRKQLEEKRRKAAEELKHKRLVQKENMQRLLKQEEEWKNDVEISIGMKNERSRLIQQEKEELLNESRTLAQASQLLREELRMAYSIDHIDKMAKRAELEARIQRPMDITSNLSTFNLN